MSKEVELLERLRTGDEAAFAELVDSHHVRLVRFAQTFVTTRQSAEDVVQDTWVAVIRGLDRFEERSSLQTWLFRICANRARTRSGTDYRLLPTGVSDFDAKGAWIDPPEPWSAVDDRLTAEKLAPLALVAIADLPPAQRQVVTLRDIEGLTSEEACEVLSITPANQRVLLHRARAQVREVIAASIGDES